MAHPTTTHDYRSLFVGVDALTPTLNGGTRKYVNLDNAASTPPLLAVQDAVNQFMPFYSSVHRGTGFKSQLSTHAYEMARSKTLAFVGADPQTHTCIFGKNTTEALNKLAHRFPFTPERNVVLTTGLEHHSNDLPWRAAGRTIHVGLTPDGRLDEAEFDHQLARYAGQVALVVVAGASNVTGFLLPIHRLAEKAHAAGAQIAVDCAQLAPHRKVDMRTPDDPACLDYVAISAHKMYAPFGAGALIGRRAVFEQGAPDMQGGGTVEIVTLDSVTWAGPPDREEAGSPNTVGAVALAAAIHKLEQVGMQAVADHEAELTSYALRRLQQIPEVHIFGDADPERAASRLGVIPFSVKGISHFKVAAILGHEFAIGVRSGCFCAHPYILHLLGLSPTEAETVRQNMLAGDKRNMPGLIRASFGLYNTIEDVDALAEALERIVAGDFKGEYTQETTSGEYRPTGWQPNYNAYFSLESS
ncbi:MAG TPA: aminotransferase class V-fold PLP-dependent enzyme [Anaerolineales bacterium]|nr:aminotransferase class V-fold PLP-dependent enzyme [Anaerolineales bacterium]